MSIRKISFALGEFYHLYNRGNSKQLIFRDKVDYERFQKLLFVSNSTSPFKIEYINRSKQVSEQTDLLVSIGAYCLMPNHFHILLTPVKEDGVSKFMQKVSTGYSMYFNKKYNRTGTLFEGKFKSKYVDSDKYLKYLFAYIHLNPVKLIQSDWKEQGIRDADSALLYAKTYKYSSLPDYVGSIRPERAILTLDPFPEYFPTVTKNESNLLEWITFDEG